jgi:hypothetical protein
MHDCLSHYVANSTTAWPPPGQHIGSAALNLCFPRGNLIGMYVELLGKLRQCPIALDGGKRSGYGALTA